MKYKDEEVVDKHREEAEHGRKEAPADPTEREAEEEEEEEESATQSAKDGIEIGWGTMDPAEELVASTMVAGGGGRDLQRRRSTAAVVAEEPSRNGESDGKNPSIRSIGGFFFRYGAQWKNTEEEG